MATTLNTNSTEYTAAEWASNNPVLRFGEMARDSDTGQIKFGNGTDEWTALPYVGSTISLAQGKLLGRGSAAGTGAPQEISVGTGLLLSGNTLSAVGGTSIATQVLTADESSSDTNLTAINNDLPVVVDPDSIYSFEYFIRWRSSDTASGVAFSIHVGFSFPAQWLLMYSEVPTGVAATIPRWQTDQTESGPITTSGSIDTANVDRFALVRGMIHTHATTPGDIQLRYCGDGGGASITIKAGTFVRFTKIA